MTTLPLPPLPTPAAARLPAHPAGWRALRTVNWSDPLYRGVLTALALVLPFLIVALVTELVVSAWPAIKRFGLPFLWTSVWDPVAEVYGAAPMIFGTLASSLLALLVELLAAIPSVVYGLWGIFVLIPFLRAYLVPPLRATLGWTPFVDGVFYGSSLLAGAIILAIMVVPYIAAVAREVLLAVPPSQREAALGMGATRWEAVWTAVVPYGRAGLVGAVILGLGRALGETMAVTMRS